MKPEPFPYECSCSSSSSCTPAVVFGLQCDIYGSGCLLSCAGRILLEHVGLAGNDDLVYPVNKIVAGLGDSHNARGIDVAIFRLALFTVLTLGAVLLFIPPFFVWSGRNLLP